MSSGQNSGGLMSSAGLVRYFDAEDRNAIRVNPKSIVAFGVFFGVLIMVLPLKGAMAEAAGGGQKFAFEPL